MLDGHDFSGLSQLLAAACHAPAGSAERQALVSQIQQDPALYGVLLEQASNGQDRAQQLKAKNSLLWLQQQSKG